MTQKFQRVPRHVAIIMDGNRRFAKRLMLKPWMGHEWGAKKLFSVMEWCREYNISELTVYAFSIQNFNRPKQEFDYLMKLFSEEYARYITDERLKDVRISFIGRIHLFPETVQAQMKDLMERTAKNSTFLLNFAMAYGGREEVLDATKRIAREVAEGKLDVEKINEEIFERHLYTPDAPDLVIRTGGEHRTSNFLIWQANYAEWMFVEKLWPEFEAEDFIDCLREYDARDRRFGK